MITLNKTIIKFDVHVTTNSIYKETIPEIRNFYIQKQAQRELDIVWSFENTKYIDAGALPLLLSIGQILKDSLRKPTTLIFRYVPELLSFLYTAKFFFISKGSEIFEFNEELIGGFGTNAERKNREIHVTHVFRADLIYPYLETSKKAAYRKYVVDHITSYLMYSGFIKVVNDFQQFRDDEFFPSCYGEIVANAVLHSESIAYVFAQSTRYGTDITISDAGIGLKSLENKRADNIRDDMFMSIRERYRKRKVNPDFLGIMDMLEYSRRAIDSSIITADHTRNLWTIWKSIMDIGGCIWIHTNNVRVKFNGKYCLKKCGMEDFGSCTKCILKKRRYWYCEYPAQLKGIHIDIHIPRR